MTKKIKMVILNIGQERFRGVFVFLASLPFTFLQVRSRPFSSTTTGLTIPNPNPIEFIGGGEWCDEEAVAREMFRDTKDLDENRWLPIQK